MNRLGWRMQYENGVARVCSLCILLLASVAHAQQPQSAQATVEILDSGELRLFLRTPETRAPEGEHSATPGKSPLLTSAIFQNMDSRGDAAPGDSAVTQTLLIESDAQGGVRVLVIDSPDDPKLGKHTGLLIWNEQGQEFWRDHAAGRPRQGRTVGFASEVRSAGNPAGPAAGAIGSSTNPLSQLASLSGSRGGDSGKSTLIGSEVVVNPKITVRRHSVENEGLPVQRLTIRSEGEDVLSVRLAEGQSSLAWSEIDNLPPELADGLPPGSYSISSGGEPAFQFVVKSDQERTQVLEFPESIEPLLEGLPDNLGTMLSVQVLLAHETDYGKKQPLISDALTEIEKLPQEKVGSGLSKIRETMLAQLTGSKPPDLDAYGTGLDSIDEARRLIAAGRWTQASRALRESSAGSESDRARGLRSLYQAVIEAQAGVANHDKADSLYRQAINLLVDSEPSDSWRAYNNYGVFLLNSAQDHLNNHAFQIATGAGRPLSRALIQWQRAKQAFEIAEFLAAKVDDATIANVRINRARHSALVSDILNTLSLREDSGSELRQKLASRSAEFAEQLASSLLEQPELDSLARGCAAEVLAQLGYRSERFAEAKLQVDRAIAEYTDAASLEGVESSLRLRGLVLAAHSTNESNDVALDAFELSSLISDFLYDQIPQDETGYARAGFYSRRAYVVEKLIEQAIQDDEIALALRFAEDAKARSLREVLLGLPRLDAANIKEQAGDPSVAWEAPRHENGRFIGDIVGDLDEDTVLLEYFVGSESSYVFLVTRNSVEAVMLRQADGSPIESRRLIQKIVQLQQNMGHQAPKMLARLNADKGWDPQWQHDLHDLYKTLIPNEFQKVVKGAKRLIIVPHHVLHYVPYSALVTMLDETASPKQIAKPQFLIDHFLSITITPSIVSWDALSPGNAAIESANAIGLAEFEYAPSLPGVKEDLANFQSIFSAHVDTVLPGSQANEAAVKQLLGRPGVLLIATHGQNVADRPLSSYVLCHSAGTDDGRLTAAEIFTSKVQAELVVLSACYTGLADRSPLPGDDLFGIQRAFLRAGSSAVVSGLWDVYDGTGPELVEKFFERFEAGKSAEQALAESQRAFLKHYREAEPSHPFVHPYFWAVYNVAGNGRVRMTEH